MGYKHRHGRGAEQSTSPQLPDTNKIKKRIADHTDSANMYGLTASYEAHKYGHRYNDLTTKGRDAGRKSFEHHVKATEAEKELESARQTIKEHSRSKLIQQKPDNTRTKRK